MLLTCQGRSCQPAPFCPDFQREMTRIQADSTQCSFEEESHAGSLQGTVIHEIEQPDARAARRFLQRHSELRWGGSW